MSDSVFEPGYGWSAQTQTSTTARRDLAGPWIWSVTLLTPMLVILGVALQPWVAAGDLLRDPLAVAEMTPDCCKVYFGAVSNAGVLIWASAAAICLFAAAVLAVACNSYAAPSFFFASGLFTGFLALDDLYLVHENVLPALGVPEPVTYGIYGFIGLLYLGFAWRQILANRYWLFVLAVALLGTSVAVDLFFHSEHRARIITEDGAKLGGIFAWSAFLVVAAWSALTGKREAA